MAEPNACPECGAPLPADSPHGLCPACLLKRGLESNTLPNTAPSPAWTPPTPAELVTRFPELDILRLIGRGGMGAVYQARQKNLNREVALKILPPEIGRDPSFTERFSREAQAMARLNHPHIVTIHEFGEREGLFYFLMEFVDGMSLRELLRTGHVTPKEALAIVPQICEALQYAHEQGIVHRDIKPENILINKQGQVKIADFGLAKLMGRAGESEKIMGTPQYMAPEQFNRPADVDHRADIYSLGVVFYQMLTGELPTGRFAAPSKKVQIDVRLDEVVLKALEREPEKRYQQVSQVQTEVTMITQTPWRAAYAQAKSAPPAEGEAAGGAGQKPLIGPRFSRAAILGALWAPLFFLMALAAMVHVRYSTPAEPPLGPAWWQYALMFTLLPLGFAAPFGTTILGAVALSQIRHSSGRLYGLGLALADTLFFPLLALDAFLIWASCGLALAIAHFVGEPSFPPEPWGHDFPVPFLWTTLAIALCLISNIWIIRSAWRAAGTPLTGEPISPAPPPRHFSSLRAKTLSLGVLALAIAIGIAGDHFFDHPTTTPVASQTSALPAQVTWPENDLNAFRSALGHNDPPDTLVLAIGPVARPPEMNRPGVLIAHQDSAWFTMDEDWVALQSDSPPHRATVFLGKRSIDRARGQLVTSEPHLVAVDVEANGKELTFFTSSWSSPQPQPGKDFTRVAAIRDFPPGSPPKSIRIYAGQPFGGSNSDFSVHILTDTRDELLDGRLMPDGSVRLTPRRGYMPDSGWELLSGTTAELTPADSCLRDIYGGGPQIGNNGWVLGTPVEKTIPDGSGIALASGEILPPLTQLPTEKEKATDLTATHDGLRALDMQVTPTFGDSWNLTPVQVADTIDGISHTSPPLTSLVPTGNPTYIFRTRNGRMGLLQILAGAQNPPTTKIRYKLLEHTGPPTQGVYRSLEELLAALPADARPDPKSGWDEFSSAKATQWFEDHIYGKGCCVTIASVVEDVNIDAHTGGALQWDASFSLDVHPPHAPGVTLSLQNGGGFGALLGPNSFLTVAGDEPFARAAKALAPGAHVSVSGVIDQCRVYPSLGLSMDLIAPAVTWPKVAATAPAPPVSPEVAIIGRWESTKIENDPDVKHVVLTFSSDHKVATSTETAGAPPFEDTEPWAIVDASHLRVGAKYKDGNEVSEVATFELSGDTLVIRSDDHITLTLRRATASPPATAP